MPYIQESVDAPIRVYECRRRSGSIHVVNYRTGADKKQRGFRSGPLTHSEKVALALSQEGKTWANNTEVITSLDYEYNSRPGRVADTVNERDFTRAHHFVSHEDWGFTSVNALTGNTVRGSGIGALYLRASAPPAIPGLFPSDSYLQGEASRMMRNAVPTAPAFNLTRALGELRHAHLFFRIGNYSPRSLKEAGGSYLNFVFGLQPTAKDIANLASTIIDADRIVREFIAHERKAVRRRRTMALYQGERTWSFTPSSDIRSSLTLQDSGYVFGNIETYCPPWGPGSNGSNQSALRYHVSATITGELRMFATFEYFIPRPAGLMDRLSRYKHIAERLLGGGLDASTSYALAPWSWLVDWYIDIGGLLRYQQSVATNSVVASRSGWVYDARVVLESSAGRRPGFTEAYGPSSGYAAAINYRRRPGGPYSLINGWSLSGSQWAILGALGLSRQNRF